ncbi:MAG TPA: hypothetical protein VJH37_03300 [Candidatus Nanoarchaeia archaeon]|nr:hypothetical protein [Candidatus Nanoarchaeia archaeon]
MTMTTTAQETKIFYHSQVEQALQNCQAAGYSPLFMPQLAEARMNGTVPWNEWRSAPSIKATGRTQQGNPVVVYAHIPNWLANPANIRLTKQQGLINGAGRLPREEFLQLVDQDGKVEQGERVVWVVDYDVLRKAPSGRIPVAQALEHPQTIPFLGGQARAEHYLSAHTRVYNTSTIGVWHTDDLNDNSPLARLLYLSYLGDFGLSGDDGLGGSGQFVVVRNTSAEGAAQKITAPTKTIITPSLDDILRVTSDLVPKFAQDELTIRLRKLYKQ